MVKKFNSMAELAADCGLSRSTVSHILNGRWRELNISPKTAKKVLDLAQKTNFSPNVLSQMITGKIQTDIAILMPREPYEHHQKAFFDLLAFIERKNLKYQVFQLGGNENNLAVIDRLRDFRVRRAILIAAPVIGEPDFFSFWQQAANQSEGIDWFFYDYRYDRQPADFAWPANVRCCGFDNLQAMQKVVEFVAANGYRKLWLLPQSIGALAQDAARALDIEVALLDYAKPESSDPAVLGRKLGKQLAGRNQQRKSPEAVFISDDPLTIHAILALLEAGCRVPEDYAFISWDGLILSDCFRRSLTTLMVPHTEMLRYAEQFILGEPVNLELLVIPTIRLGESMPPPSRNNGC